MYLTFSYGQNSPLHAATTEIYFLWWTLADVGTIIIILLVSAMHDMWCFWINNNNITMSEFYRLLEDLVLPVKNEFIGVILLLNGCLDFTHSVLTGQHHFYVNWYAILKATDTITCSH